MIRKTRPELSSLKLMTMYIILIAISMVSCNLKPSNQCNDKDKLRIGLSGHLSQTICAGSDGYLTITNKQLRYSAPIKAPNKNCFFELFIQEYNGPGKYSFGAGKSAYCHLNDLELVNEYYHSVKGEITITEADKNHLKAIINAEMQGFINYELLQMEVTINH